MMKNTELQQKSIFNKVLTFHEEQNLYLFVNGKSKWNKIGAFVFTVVIFVILMIIVAHNMLDSNSECSKCRKITDAIEFRSLFTIEELKCQQKSNQCVIICKYIKPQDSLVKYINVLLSTMINCKTMSLEIHYATFSNSTIYSGWLSGLDVNINTLKLYKCDLMEIAEHAFADNPFEDLHHLIIEDSKIIVLRQRSFLRMNSMVSFAFRYSSSIEGICAEKGALLGMSSTLTSLEMKNCLSSPEVVENLTGPGSNYLSKLKIADFGYNMLETLTANSFVGLTTASSIYLNNNNLKVIHPAAFYPLTTIQRLTLNNNNLEIIPEGIFDKISYTGSLYLQGNHWKCNCSLQWLKCYYMRTSFIDKDIPPLCMEEMKSFDEVDFGCTDISTTSTETPDTYSPPSDEQLLQLACRDVTLFPTITPPNIQRDYTKTIYLYIRNQSIACEFYELDTEVAGMEIKIYGDITDHHLLWFNTNNSKSDKGCVTRMKDLVVLNGLERGATYTLCIVLDQNSMVSPYDCSGFTVKPEWKFRALILNKSLLVVVASLSGCLLGTAIFSAFVVFYCIRQNPNLIRGNKRVIMVESKVADAIVMPKPYEKPVYVESSLASGSHGYLTPKNHLYSRPFMRSISESSALNGSNSIYSFISSSQHVTGKMKHLRQRSRISNAYHMDYDSDEDVPPLPPPNPRQIAEQQFF